MQKDAASGISTPGQEAARSGHSDDGGDVSSPLKRMPAMMHSIDARGEVIDVSDLWLEKMGYRREEVIGRKSTDFFPPASRKLAQEKGLPDVFATGAVREAEYQFVKKDGEVVAVILSANSEYDENGVFRRSLAILKGVTACRKSPAALRRSEQFFRRAFDQAPAGAAVVGLDYKFMQVNREFCRITGYDREELFNMGFPEITHPDDLNRDLRLARDLKEGHIDQYQVDKCYLRKGGRSIWARLSVRLIRDDRGRPLYYLSVLEDIDQRKRLEDEKSVQLELLRLVNADMDLEQVVAALLSYRARWTQIDAVGLRLKSGDDFPYFETRGFPETFVRQENRLCRIAYKGQQVADSQRQPMLECMCGRVIDGRVDPAQPFFTATGSFWTDSTSALLARSKALGLPPGTRNRCNQYPAIDPARHRTLEGKPPDGPAARSAQYPG